MRLYHCTNARSFRALWTLEELGLDYELVNLPFPPRERAPDYLAVNPLGTVPTLVDGETVLTESTGICHYLAERHQPNDLRIGPDEPGYGAYLNWLYRSDATLTFPLTVVLRYREGRAAEDYTIWFLSRVRSVERALDGRDFLVAGRFTMADLAVHFALMVAVALGLRGRLKPNCLRWYDALTERPAFDRAMARQGLPDWRTWRAQTADATGPATPQPPSTGTTAPDT